jgi:hypothetical protein
MMSYLVAKLTVTVIAYIWGGSAHCFEDYSQCWAEAIDGERYHVITLDNSWWEHN